MTEEIPPIVVRQAHHEAGHVIAAAAFGIPIRSVSNVFIEEEPPGTQLASLIELIESAPVPPRVVGIVENYAVAKLAGLVAEMIHTRNLLRERGHELSWTRYRKRWLRVLENEENRDLDTALALAFGWSGCQTMEELGERFVHLWTRAEALLLQDDQWRKVTAIVQALLERDVLTGAEALAILKDC